MSEKTKKAITQRNINNFAGVNHVKELKTWQKKGAVRGCPLSTATGVLQSYTKTEE